MNKLAGAAVSLTVAGGMVLAAAPSSQAATTIRSMALSTAKAQKGDPYRYGAAGPDAFDCSGLVYYSYRKHGKTLSRTAQGQYDHSTHVSPSSRKAGDLVFIFNRSGAFHVGIYAGVWKDSHGVPRGWMVDAPHTGSYVGTHQIRYYTGGPSVWAKYGRYYG
jgi:cell wall-associated NlpC family hydrolase